MSGFVRVTAMVGWYGLAAFALWLTANRPSRERLESPVDSATPTSLLQVLADPQRWHGKHVRVAGFFNFEFEHDALYLTSEDSRNHLFNGLWINVPELLMGSDRRDPWRGYAVVEGIVNAQRHGHLGLWPASIDSVIDFVPFLSREEVGHTLKNVPPIE